MSKVEKTCKASAYHKLPTTSAKIRAMAKDGFSRGQISRSGLTTKQGNPIRYQHVRNVLITPLKG